MEEGEQRAKELAVMFIETSAKSSYNVKQVYAVSFHICIIICASALLAKQFFVSSGICLCKNLS